MISAISWIKRLLKHGEVTKPPMAQKFERGEDQIKSNDRARVVAGSLELNASNAISHLDINESGNRSHIQVMGAETENGNTNTGAESSSSRTSS